MKSLKTLFFTTVLIFAMPVLIHAKTFSSQFAEFELPTGWECALEGSEWVCQSEDKDRKKEAIIILAAKYRGEQDSLDQYQAYLKGAKTFTLPGGRTQISEPKAVTIKTINGQRWVDSLHLASEVPGFYTRYLATVKDNLGIAVTFSVAKDHYDAYQDIFEKVVATLRVFDNKAEGNTQFQKKKSDEDLAESTTVIGDTNTNPNIGVQKKGGQGGGDSTTESILIIAAVAVVGFILLKARKKKK